MAFDDRVFTTDSGGARPVLTLFEHVPGSKVSEGLFNEYTLPNGRKVFMYCAGGFLYMKSNALCSIVGRVL